MKRLALVVLVLAVLGGAWFLLRKRSSGVDQAGTAPAGKGAGEGDARRKRGPIEVGDSKQPSSSGRLVAKGRWGNGAGEYGHKPADESNPEGPMSIVAGKGGVVVLDQVNSRVVRLGPDGKPLSTLPIGPDTARELAVDDKGRVAVLDRVGQGEVSLYDENGNLTGQAPVAGGPIEEAGAATGIFTGDSGTWVEREHTESVRVLGPDGKPDPDRPTLPGRPTRSGSGSIQAALIDKGAGTAWVRRFDNDAVLVWQRTVTFPAPIVSILMLDSDLGGHVYLAAHVAVESSEPPYVLTDERIIVVRMAESDGEGEGSLVLPAITAPEETASPVAVGNDGTIYLMTPGPDGLEIHAYTF